MSQEEAIGIVLTIRRFEESHKIATVFTFKQGLIKLFIRDGFKKQIAIQPLSKIDFIYKKGPSGLDYHLEGKIICQLPKTPINAIQNRLIDLQVAGKMSQLVLHTQTDKNPSSKLYLLFESYLTALPLSLHPDNLFSSFQTKLLLHEGVLSLENECKECKQLLYEVYLCQGACFCKTHANQNFIFFSHEESKKLFIFGLGKKMSEIDSLPCSRIFQNKIQTFFEQLQQEF